MNLEIFHIQPLDRIWASSVARPENTSENIYTSIAIEDLGRYFYWAKGVSIEISHEEYKALKMNPKLYYFSTALKLHLRIIRALEKRWLTK